MKSLKLLFILMALMVTTGLKAADTLKVEDLTYQTIVVGTDSIVIEDSVTSADAILANYREGCHAKGYKLVVPSEVSVIMIGDGGGMDTYSFLFDSEFKLITKNDDYDGYNTGYGMKLEQGVYYWVVTSYSNYCDYPLTITIIPFTPIFAKDFQYKPISMNTTVYDSLIGDDPAVDDVRPACHAKGYTFTVDTKQCVDIKLKFPSDTMGWDSYLYLLDDKYRVILENDDDDDDSDNGSRLAYMVDPGTYYIIVTQYSSTMGEFLLSLSGVELTDYAAMTYTPIVPDTTVTDTIINNRYVTFYNYAIANMNGYSTTMAQGDMLRITLNAYMTMIVLDADFQQVDVNEINGSYGYIFKAEQAGTYYFILVAYSKKDESYDITFTLWNKTRDNVYYIDEVNGDNNNTGVISQDPLASLEYALDNKIIPNGGATCYLMSDVKLTKKYDLNKVALTILPYKGGNYTISSNVASYLSFKGSNVEIGSADSGSITITFPYNGTNTNCIYNDYGHVTLNNVHIQKSNCYHVIQNHGTMTLNNCVIENNVSSSNSIVDYLHMTLNNVSIHHNNSGSDILKVSSAVAELNNVQMDSNSSLYPAIDAEYAKLYINGGEMKGNTGHWDTAIIFNNYELTAENRGGILSMWSDIYVNGDFTMNNNYAILANDDVFTLGDNVTAENIGVILPVRIDPGSSDLRLIYNYEEGVPVLEGNVYANYKRFDLYQPYNGVTWYIISDGTLSATNDVAVAEAEEAGDNVNIYPNPTSGMLNIRVADASVTGIRLVDIQGRIITSQQVTGESIQLDMQSLAHGMYFVQLMNHQGVLSTRKVVKK